MSADETPTGAEPTTDVTRTWPELAESLYERLTGRGAEISYEFENMSVEVPSRAGEGAEHANWRLDGTLRIHTRDHGRRGEREQP